MVVMLVLSCSPIPCIGQKYTELFRFEKQEKTKTAGDKKRVTYFSDLTLAEPGEDEGKNASTGGDGGDGDRAAKRSRADRDNGERACSQDFVSCFDVDGAYSCFIMYLLDR